MSLCGGGLCTELLCPQSLAPLGILAAKTPEMPGPSCGPDGFRRQISNWQVSWYPLYPNPHSTPAQVACCCLAGSCFLCSFGATGSEGPVALSFSHTMKHFIVKEL